MSPPSRTRARRRLAGGLGEIAGGDGLVIDLEQLGRGAGEELDIGRRRARPEGREEPGLAVQRIGGGIGAGSGQLDRRQGIAGGKAGVEEHLRPAAMGPLVEPGDGIGRQRERAGAGGFRQAEQAAAGRGPCQRAGEAGGPEQPRKARRHQGPAQLGAHLIAHDRRGDEGGAGNPAALGECQQARQDHHAQMADAAGMHILAHQPVTRDRIGEGSLENGAALGRAHDMGRALVPGAEAGGLAAPGQVAGLQRAGEEIQQADLELLDRRRRRPEAGIEDLARQAPGEGRLRGHAQGPCQRPCLSRGPRPSPIARRSCRSR